PIFDGAQWFGRALPLGVRMAQLRVKDRPEGEIRDEIRRSLAEGRKYGAEIVVNDYWQLAIEEGARWLHLGQEDLEAADLKRIRDAGMRIGISTHDHRELERALSVSPD